MTLQELLDKCRDNINSEAVFQEIVREHDKQIRKDYAKEIALNFDEMDKTAYRMGRADGIAQGEFDGKIEAIDECIKYLCDDWSLEIMLSKCNKGDMKEYIQLKLQQLKEQK